MELNGEGEPDSDGLLSAPKKKGGDINPDLLKKRESQMNLDEKSMLEAHERQKKRDLLMKSIAKQQNFSKKDKR